MNILMPLHTDGYWLERALQDCGHDVIALNMEGTFNFDVDFIIPVHLQHELEISREDYNSYLYRFLDKLRSAEKFDFIFPWWPEYLSTYYNKNFLKKHEYYNILVDTTKIPNYKTVNCLEDLILMDEDSLKYPFVIKPSAGYASTGIYVCRSKDDFVFYKNPETNNNLSKEAQCYRKRTSRGIMKHFVADLYNEMIIQDYLEGETISVFGLIQNKNIFIDLITKIESIDLPFRSKVGFSGPKYDEKLIDITHNIIHKLDLDNSPFMLDFVYDGVDYYLIDYSNRCSSSALEILTHFDKKYPQRIIDLYYTSLSDYHFETDFYYGFIHKPHGIIQSIKYPNIPDSCISHSFKLYNGDRIFMPVFDRMLIRNGYALFVGKNARENFMHFNDSILIEYL